MNQYVPAWNLEDDSTPFSGLPAMNQRKPKPDNELIELLWQDGHVIMHSQSHRKSPATFGEFKQAQKAEPAPKCGGDLGNSSDLIQEDETASWFQYPIIDDSLEKELCSEFFCEMPNADAMATNRMSKDTTAEGERSMKFGANDETSVLSVSDPKQSNIRFQENTMPPPKSHVIASSTQQAPRPGNSSFVNFSHFSRPVKADLGLLNGRLRKESGKEIQVGAGESSMMTIGSRISGSKQTQSLAHPSHTVSSDGAAGVVGRGSKEDARMTSLSERVQTHTYETTVTSSSGGSGCSFGRTGQKITCNQSHKRKGRDAEESECQSEEAEYESVEANKPAQRSTSTRRSRAAEVHNLSERRRRDRINEKMKALQELIPHCNKTDKASMLDEAIEYLKSLQLQVQIMWMGSGMAPMMFPGVQQYMSSMGMGVGQASMPSIHGPVQLPQVPFVNQSIASTSTAYQRPLCSSPALNAVNFPNQIQNVHPPETYAQYLGLHPMQSPTQAMNFCTFGSHMVQQNQTMAAPGSSIIPTALEVPSENNQNNNSGK